VFLQDNLLGIRNPKMRILHHKSHQHHQPGEVFHPRCKVVVHSGHLERERELEVPVLVAVEARESGLVSVEVEEPGALLH